MFPWLQGVVIGVGEMSEFGSVFKMMQSEEVCGLIYMYSLIQFTFFLSAFVHKFFWLT